MLSVSSRIFRLFFLVLAAGTFLCQAQAQPSRSPLQGKVLDPARAPIAGAKVTAIPDGRTSGPSAVSDQNGDFTLPLEDGKYTFKAAKDGFVEARGRSAFRKLDQSRLVSCSKSLPCVPR